MLRRVRNKSENQRLEAHTLQVSFHITKLDPKGTFLPWPITSHHVFRSVVPKHREGICSFQSIGGTMECY